MAERRNPNTASLLFAKSSFAKEVSSSVSQKCGSKHMCITCNVLHIDRTVVINYLTVRLYYSLDCEIILFSGFTLARVWTVWENALMGAVPALLMDSTRSLLYQEVILDVIVLTISPQVSSTSVTLIFHVHCESCCQLFWIMIKKILNGPLTYFLK